MKTAKEKALPARVELKELQESVFRLQIAAAVQCFFVLITIILSLLARMFSFYRETLELLLLGTCALAFAPLLLLAGKEMQKEVKRLQQL